MGKLKIVSLNSKGNIELSKDELQHIVDDAYNEGYKDGKDSPKSTITYGDTYGKRWWDSVYYSTATPSNILTYTTKVGDDPNTLNTITCSVDNSSKD